MKRRAITPHAPPPTSKKGPALTHRIGAALEWHWLDAHGVVHQTKPQLTALNLGITVCMVDHVIEETLAPVTCLWCIAGRSIWS
jgi:hypothetical protein